MNKPKLFIASAKESTDIVDVLELGLIDCATIKRWDIGSFKAGEFSLESLLNQVAVADFAAFVLGQDDKTESRGKSQPSPRDNVIFEAGLFCSKLGPKRTFFIVDSRGTKRPSDWDGLGYLTYFADRDERRQRVLEAVNEIDSRVRELGAKISDKPAAALNDSWWQMVLNSDEGSVLSLLEIDADAADIKVTGRSWSHDGKSHATYRSRSASYNAGDQLLCYSWEGEREREGGLPKYFGTGEIRFDLKKKDAPLGRGYYTDSTAESITTFRQCLYVHASEEELALLAEGDLKKTQALARKLLGKRQAILD